VTHPMPMLALVASLLLTSAAAGQTRFSRDLSSGRDVDLVRDVTIEPRLDELVPRDLVFRDQNGRAVRIGDYLGEKPVLLQLVYLRCPMLCGAQIEGLTRCLSAMTMSAGEEFTVLNVSFDPEETVALARDKRASVLKRYDRPSAERGWHFLTGDAASIDRLTEAVGFRYVRDPESGQFAHAAGIVVLTPEGRIARYLYGVDYSWRDVRLAIIDATDGRIATATDQVLLFCYLYDPTTGKYGLAIMNLVRFFGLLTVGVLGVVIVRNLRRERRSGHDPFSRAPEGSAPPPSTDDAERSPTGSRPNGDEKGDGNAG
jgi:protein SCO1